MPFSYLYQITNLCQCLLNSSTVHTNVTQSFYSLKGCFLKASVLPVWAHAGLTGWFALLWCWPGLCMALHFISPADMQKQGAAWWPGCRSSSSQQLQLHSLYSIVLIGCRFVTGSVSPCRFYTEWFRISFSGCCVLDMQMMQVRQKYAQMLSRNPF